MYLAPDLDREGEAIAWHLSELLQVDPERVFRVVFNEITKKAILEAFAQSGQAQHAQGRRAASPPRARPHHGVQALAAPVEEGRQGSVGRARAVGRGAIDRRARGGDPTFQKEEYWRVTAQFEEAGTSFAAELRRVGERRIERNLGGPEAQAIVARLQGAAGPDSPCTPLDLVEIEIKPKTRRPTPPFTTSQLQQKASTMMRFSARKTMMIAQQLYEGVELPGEGSVGLITYMRTDSVRVGEDALEQARRLIERDFGKPYVPEAPTASRPERAARRKRTRRSVPPRSSALPKRCARASPTISSSSTSSSGRSSSPAR